MRNKKLYLIVLLVMLALSACVPNNSANLRTLGVSGVGQVSVAPDIAYIYIGVHTETDSASDAVDNRPSPEKANDTFFRFIAFVYVERCPDTPLLVLRYTHIIVQVIASL